MRPLHEQHDQILSALSEDDLADVLDRVVTIDQRLGLAATLPPRSRPRSDAEGWAKELTEIVAATARAAGVEPDRLLEAARWRISCDLRAGRRMAA